MIDGCMVLNVPRRFNMDAHVRFNGTKEGVNGSETWLERLSKLEMVESVSKFKLAYRVLDR